MNINKKSLHNIPTWDFGILFNDKVTYNELLKHRKCFSTVHELEKEMNKLCTYIFDSKRKVMFHEFRKFPYIRHYGMDEASDMAGLCSNYMQSDISFIRFILAFLKYKRGNYIFLDADYIIENTLKTQWTDVEINKMPIDVLLDRRIQK